jgi:hypothetical protein
MEDKQTAIFSFLFYFMNPDWLLLSLKNMLLVMVMASWKAVIFLKLLEQNQTKNKK